MEDNSERREGLSYEPFVLQPSIIDAVTELCPEHEAEEIWRIVGHSLVEQARDLLEEAKIHLEIWLQLREDADHAASRAIPKALPEPPMVRERLVQEIRFLVDHLRTKSRSPNLTPHTTNDRSIDNVLEYVTADHQHATLHSGSGCGSGCGNGCGRPLSSRDGRETPLRLSTPSSLDGSHSSLLSVERSVIENISLNNIDSTVQYLREALEEEISQRRDDIVFLQECSEGECHHHLTSSSRPSLRELREVGTQLEREVMSITSRGITHPSPLTVDHIPRPPNKCAGRSLMSCAVVRRASGIKSPHSIISTDCSGINHKSTATSNQCTMKGGELFSTHKYTNAALTINKTHSQSIT